MIKIKVKLDATVYDSDMLMWSHDMSSGCQLTNQNDHAEISVKGQNTLSGSPKYHHTLLILDMA